MTVVILESSHRVSFPYVFCCLLWLGYISILMAFYFSDNAESENNRYNDSGIIHCDHWLSASVCTGTKKKSLQKSLNMYLLAGKFSIHPANLWIPIILRIFLRKQVLNTLFSPTARSKLPFRRTIFEPSVDKFENNSIFFLNRKYDFEKSFPGSVSLIHQT